MSARSASLPAAMACIEAAAPGGPDVLRPATRPLPKPAAGEVLIRVAAAGVNRAETLQRAGAYPPPPGATDLLGLEVAGEVAATAPDVTTLKVGDRVCALTNGGGYAEYCPAPASHCLPIPRGLTLIEAASLPEAAFTVWTNVFDRARLVPGETFLVHGGSSGIGVMAIQMARHLGSRVMATAGTDEKCQACRSLGAEVCVNYRREDFVAAAKAFTQGRGIDVILDMVGGDYIAKNIEALAIEGRMVNIAHMKGSVETVDFRPVMMKRLTITASTLRPQSVAAKARMADALRAKIWPALDAGTIRPAVFKTYPLARAADAHRLMESSAHIGKIVLEVADF